MTLSLVTAPSRLQAALAQAPVYEVEATGAKVTLENAQASAGG